MTSVSASWVCLNPEDENREPYCLEVADAALVGDLDEGACVCGVGTLDRKLVRAKALDRTCRLPTR